MRDARSKTEACGVPGRLEEPRKRLRPAPRRVLGALLCATLLGLLGGGCGRSSRSQTAGNSDEGASPDAAAEQAAANALKTQPLSDADVNLYLDIMKAAADQITNPSGQDRAAIDFARQVNSGKATGAVTPDQAQLLVHATQLAQLDETIAAQRGVQARYDAIRGVVEGLVGPMVCTSCSGDGGAQATSAAQQQEWDKEQAVQETDLKLLEPHRAEIESVQKQVRGFLTNQPSSN